MKLIRDVIAFCLFLSIAKAEWRNDGATRAEECLDSKGLDVSRIAAYCGTDPWCPYPDQELKRHVIGIWPGYRETCCCAKNNKPVYRKKLTKIWAICDRMQACEDYPYCDEEYIFWRNGDRCCCQPPINYDFDDGFYIETTTPPEYISTDLFAKLE